MVCQWYHQPNTCSYMCKADDITLCACAARQSWNQTDADAVPVYGDQHCCYEDSDSLPGHSSLSSPSGPSSSAGRSSGSHQGRKQEGREQRSMSHWTTEHWISINSRIWQQGGVGSQTASASFVKNTHNYQNETINNTFIYFKMFVRSQSESFNKFRKFGAKLAQEFSKFSMTTF